MEKCSKCGVVVGKYEMFPEQLCLACYAVVFEKQFQSALKIARLK